MLAKRGILAFSPELGRQGRSSETFFIKTSTELKQVILENYVWMKYTMLKLQESNATIQMQNIYEPRRYQLDETNIILTLELHKSLTQKVAVPSLNSAMTEVPCH